MSAAVTVLAAPWGSPEVHLKVGSMATPVAAILAHLDTQGDKLIDLRVERPSLEERFLEITTHEITSNGGA